MDMNLSYDIAADLDTPVSAFLKLRRCRPRYLLESVRAGRAARALFLHRLRRLRSSCASTATACASTASAAARPADRRGAARAAARGARARAAAAAGRNGLRRSRAGSSATRAYDLARYFEPPPRHAASRAAPDACYLAPRSLLVFDHLTRGVTLLHDGSEPSAQALAREMSRRSRGAAAASRSGAFALRAGASQPRSRRTSSTRSRACKAHIGAGDVYQLVLSVCFEGECELDPFAVYRALRLLNPSPYMYYVELGGLTVAGSSPEALVQLSRPARDAAADRGHAAARRRRGARTRRTRAARSPTRRRTPST